MKILRIRSFLIVLFAFGLVFNLLGTEGRQEKEDPLDRPFREPLYLIHITKTHTPYGPQERDVYILHPKTPNEDGVVMTADGYGGWFINEGSMAGGPFRTPRDVCNAVKGMDKKKLSLRFICPEPVIESKKEEDKIGDQEEEQDKEEDKEKEQDQQKDQEKEKDRKKDEEKKKEECNQERLDEEIRAINKVQDHVAFADVKYQEIKAQLGMMRIAGAKKRAKIRYLENLAKEGDYSDAMKAKLEKRAEDLRDELFEILKESDSELKNALYNYDDALREIASLQKDSKCKDVQTVLAKLQKKYIKKRDMVELELLMASCDPNQRDKFHALARRYIGENKHKDFVHLMQALDYVERKDPRSALYALRKALKENPDNTVVQNLLKNIELGYLKGIDEKITGEAAAIRSRLWDHLSQHGEEGFLGTLYDLLTTGVTASASAIGGKPQALADLAATIGDEAVVQHSGLILIIRMREAGISLKDIRDMVIKDKTSGKNPMDFSQIVKDKFGWNLSKEQSLKMRFSMNMAFKNPDVNRLSAESKQVFDIDRGKAYFNSDAFDATWQDWIGDVVNVKNVAVMLGPSAVISSGGKLAVHGSKLVEETMTVRDAFCNLIKLPQLADKLAKTKAGQAAIAELFKFEQNTGLVSKVVAEALIQQGLIKAGEMIGGKAGAVAAEIISILGVGDIDQTLRILKQNGVTPKTLANLSKALRKAAQGAEQIGDAGKKYVKQLDDAIQETAERGAVSTSTKKAMKQSQDEMDDHLRRLMRQAQDGDMPLSQRQQMEMMQTYKEAFEDAVSGNQAGARVGKKAAQALEEQSENTVRTLSKQADTVDDMANGLRKAETDVNLKQAADEASLPRQKTDPIDDLTHNSGLESPKSPKQLTTEQRVRIEASKTKHVKYSNDIDMGGGRKRVDYRAGFEEADGAMLRQDYDDAVKHYKKLSAEDLSDTVKADIKTKLKQAEAAQEAVERFKSVKSTVNDGVTQAYKKPELDDITSKVSSGQYKLVKVEKETLHKPFYLVDEAGNKIALVKPHMPGVPNKWDIKAEVLSYKISQQLDDVALKTPAAARIKLEIDGQETDCAIIRFVRGSDLEDNSLGVQYAVKKQMAEDRAKSAFMLDFDRNPGNVKIDAGGTALDIDRSSNGIGSAIKQPTEELDTFVKNTQEGLCMQRPRNSVVIENLENHYTYDDMDNVVKQLEKFQDFDESQFKTLLDGVTDHPTETQRVMRTLKNSAKHLRQTMQQNFPSMDQNLLKPLMEIRQPIPVSEIVPLRSHRLGWAISTVCLAFQGGAL